MAMFKDMLGSNETLFRDEVALSYDFIPKLIPYREKEQKYIAFCIKPLFQKINGKNLFVYGPPGIGKTVAVKRILKELEEETDDIIPIYINCWKKNSAYQIAIEICEKLNYRLTHNKRTEELLDVIKNMLNKRSAVFVFDEVDKLENVDILYHISEDIYRKSVILITNYKDWLKSLDERISSRLALDQTEFRPYNEQETYGILKERLKYAFQPNIWDDEAFNLIAKKTAQMKDIRTGLYLLKEAALSAENKSLKKIMVEDAEAAIKKLSDFAVNKDEGLTEDNSLILSVIKDNNNSKIGDLFEIYRQKNGQSSYRTFARRIEDLEKARFITTKKFAGGKEGNTTIIELNSAEKKLTDF